MSAKVRDGFAKLRALLGGGPRPAANKGLQLGSRPVAKAADPRFSEDEDEDEDDLDADMADYNADASAEDEDEDEDEGYDKPQQRFSKADDIQDATPILEGLLGELKTLRRQNNVLAKAVSNQLEMVNDLRGRMASYEGKPLPVRGRNISKAAAQPPRRGALDAGVLLAKAAQADSPFTTREVAALESMVNAGASANDLAAAFGPEQLEYLGLNRK